MTKYKKWEHELKFDGMNMDEMSVCDVGKFESLNKIKVNAHYWNEKCAAVIHNRCNTSAKTVNILLVKG